MAFLSSCLSLPLLLIACLSYLLFPFQAHFSSVSLSPLLSDTVPLIFFASSIIIPSQLPVFSRNPHGTKYIDLFLVSQALLFLSRALIVIFQYPPSFLITNEFTAVLLFALKFLEESDDSFSALYPQIYLSCAEWHSTLFYIQLK